MEFSRWKNFFVVLIMAAVLITGAFFTLQSRGNINQIAAVSANESNALSEVAEPEIVLPQKLDNPPEIIKAVYVTGYSAGTKKYLNYLNNIFKATEINAVVVDIKGSDGYVSYASDVDDVKKYNLYNGAIKDIDSLVRFFHDQNIYLIGRIAVFDDPVYSKARPELAVYDKNKTTDLSKPVLWQDRNGLTWLDPASQAVWDYNIALAKDALRHGFDEINFDYVRFPSDGKTDSMGFPVWTGTTSKSRVIKDMFQYMRKQLAGEKTSVDLFGQTTINTDDMGIGQYIEDSFESFDYVSPMVYPSHYAKDFIGFSNPADHPYEIIKYSMDSAVSREAAYAKFLLDISSVGSTPEEKSNIPQKSLAKFRPWIQDFSMGAIYNADMVRSEIKATQDSLGAGFNGFMLWNPSNIYTQAAILK